VGFSINGGGTLLLLLVNFCQPESIGFQPIQKIFHGKNYPNLLDFEELFFQIVRFLS
jgi:hypothetical protein